MIWELIKLNFKLFLANLITYILVLILAVIMAIIIVWWQSRGDK